MESGSMMQQLTAAPTAASTAPVYVAGIQQGVALVMVNNPPVNSFSPAVHAALESVYDELVKNKDVKAIVITGAGKVFMAGADIPHLLSLTKSPIKPDELKAFLKSAHGLMAKLESGPLPVVAALNGDAFGGGCELAMACNARVALAKAKMGLPELKLGVIPGMGGTQRMARLIGVKAAVESIVSSKNIKATDCFKNGLVDVVVKKPEELVPAAVKYALSIVNGVTPRKVSSALNSKIKISELELNVITNTAKLGVTKKSPNLKHPHYAIESVVAGVTKGFDAGIESEIDMFIKCLQEPVSAALLHVFVATKGAGKIPKFVTATPNATATAGKVKAPRSVAILGGGTMGAGIAICFLMKGIPVILKEVNQQFLEAGVARILSDISNIVKMRKMNPMVIEFMMRGLTAQLTYDNFDKVDVVIEAVIENIPLKQKIFKELEGVCNTKCVVATNTSTINIDNITKDLKPETRARVIGLHYFSPAYIMPLLEIVVTSSTSIEVIHQSIALAKSIGKTPVIVGNCIGFVANRIFFPYTMAGTILIQAGVSPYAIDKALMKFGMPMGIYRMNDSVGVDIGTHIAPIFNQAYPDRVYNTKLSQLMVDAKRMGIKSGKGFYDYSKNRKGGEDQAGLATIISTVMAENPALASIAKDKSITLGEKEIVEICLFPVVNEAARTLSENFASSAADVDIVSIMGYGFPAYRGGVLHWGKQTGYKYIAERLALYSKVFGEKTPALKGFFEPSQALLQLAQKN